MRERRRGIHTFVYPNEDLYNVVILNAEAIHQSIAHIRYFSSPPAHLKYLICLTTTCLYPFPLPSNNLKERQLTSELIPHLPFSLRQPRRQSRPQSRQVHLILKGDMYKIRVYMPLCYTLVEWVGKW